MENERRISATVSANDAAESVNAAQPLMQETDQRTGNETASNSRETEVDSNHPLYNFCNKVHTKLEKAMEKGELEQFLQERGGYRQRYGLMNATNRALRAFCICIALNIYGSNHPDFEPKLAETIGRVIRSGKKAMTPAFVVNQQWVFQQIGSPDLHFADRSLREDTAAYLKKQKKLTLLLGLLLFFVPSSLMLACSSAGANPDDVLFLFPVSAVLTIWGILKLVSLAAIGTTIRNLTTEQAPATDRQQGSGQA